MDTDLLTKEELIDKGYDYDDLEIEPPSDQLFVWSGEDGDELVPVNGLVSELDERDGTLLDFGEYSGGLPFGMSVDFHRNGRLKSKSIQFHGPTHGLLEKWDEVGRLLFRGDYVYGNEVRYQKWDADGNLIEEKKDPDESQLSLIERSREFYEKNYRQENGRNED